MRKGVFQENDEDEESKYRLEKGGRHKSKDMWTYMLRSDQAYKIRTARLDWRNNTRWNARALKESTAVPHATKVEGRLALVEKSKVALESLSALMDVVKLKVYYLEALIRSKGQIIEKGPKSVQVYQMKKLLDTDPFHPFSPHVQMKYYNN